MDLTQQFNAYIEKESLFARDDRLLLAVSGGLDSVVLCALCQEAGFHFAIAHANFQLRGEESGRDETFVWELAESYQAETFIRRFDTTAIAAQRKISIQVAARELRYDWFYSLLQQQREAPFTRILTAHHLDDNIETSLMNFFKGTGISGLRGILPKQGALVRPLLFARKDELLAFARDRQLTWVEDSSNASDKYTRNYFRNQLLPLVRQVYPRAEDNLASNLLRFRDTENIYRHAVVQQKQRLLEAKGSEWQVPVLKLQKTEAPATFLYEIAKDFGFSAAQVPDLLSLLRSESGKYVQSISHRMIRNRAWLVIAPLESPHPGIVLVEEGMERVGFAGGQLTLRPIKKMEESSNDAIASLDAREIRYPLLLRPWKQGDYFYPLGMKRKKKIARFLVDRKLSKTDKERIWVLESGRKIIWVLGQRIDERFRITASTQQVLRLEWKPVGEK